MPFVQGPIEDNQICINRNFRGKGSKLHARDYLALKPLLCEWGQCMYLPWTGFFRVCIHMHRNSARRVNTHIIPCSYNTAIVCTGNITGSMGSWYIPGRHNCNIWKEQESSWNGFYLKQICRGILQAKLFSSFRILHPTSFPSKESGSHMKQKSPLFPKWAFLLLYLSVMVNF